MSEELKPCPFCGSQPTWTADAPIDHEIKCMNGTCEINPTSWGIDRVKVINAWNRRSEPAEKETK